jgi:hypothetical protein
LLTWLALTGLLAALLGPAAASADTFSSWTPGPDAALDNTYDGFIDTPSMSATVPTGNFTVAGWFVDTTAQGWAGADDIQVWQGTMDGGGNMLAKATIAQSRPDVAAATGNPFWDGSGFGAVVPAGALSAGPQTLSIYAHTGGKGWWYKQVQVNVSSSAPSAAPPPTVSGGALPTIVVEQPSSGTNIPTKNTYTMMGYAVDPAATPDQGSQGSGIDHVYVYMDKEPENGGTFVGDADLAFSDPAAASKFGPQFQNAGWRLTFKPTNFHSGAHQLFVYAHSVVTGKTNLETIGIGIVES